MKMIEIFKKLMRKQDPKTGNEYYYRGYKTGYKQALIDVIELLEAKNGKN
jgi:hypothetical protein